MQTLKLFNLLNLQFWVVVLLQDHLVHLVRVVRVHRLLHPFRRVLAALADLDLRRRNHSILLLSQTTLQRLLMLHNPLDAGYVLLRSLSIAPTICAFNKYYVSPKSVHGFSKSRQKFENKYVIIYGFSGTKSTAKVWSILPRKTYVSLWIISYLLNT